MRHLIQELMEPRTYVDGVIRQPNAAMMAAGKEIMRLTTMWEQDKAGRSKAESMVNILNDQIEKLSAKVAATLNPTLEDAVLAYKAAMNRDYALDIGSD